MTVEYDKKLGFLAAFGKDFQILMKIGWQKRRGWKKLPRFIKWHKAQISKIKIGLLHYFENIKLILNL